MAGRKPEKGMPWFPHDTGYAGDEDIEVMVANYGQDGYAYPLHMYEKAYRTRGGELDISDAEKRKVYAKSCLVTPELWEQMTQTALKYRIWDREAYENRSVLTSDRIKKQMRPVLEHRERSKKIYEEKKARKPRSNSAAETPPKKAELTQSRVEESIIEYKEEQGPPPPKKEYVPPPEALRLSGILAAQILRNNPDNRELSDAKKEATLNRWAKDIDLMIRKDSREPVTIQRVILWAHQDKFWHVNILSAATLREKFDRLILDIARGGGNGNGPGSNGRHGIPEYNEKELQAIKDRQEKARAEKQGAGHGTPPDA